MGHNGAIIHGITQSQAQLWPVDTVFLLPNLLQAVV
jgi:hypothetical protein